MTNSSRFRAVVAERGMKYKFLAQELGLSPYGLQKKIDNDSEFKASEIEKLSILLSLPKDKRDDIFFAKESDL